MKRLPITTALGIATAFVAGLLVYHLYLRWVPVPLDKMPARPAPLSASTQTPRIHSPESHPVSFSPLRTFEERAEPAILQAREIEKIRALAGTRVRVRGRIYRVGHSSKSNTYFLNFGPSRDALTAVIFASGVEAFEAVKLSPKTFDGKEVEIEGEVKNHPQYGLEIIVERPAQIKVVAG